MLSIESDQLVELKIKTNKEYYYEKKVLYTGCSSINFII
jgi:hypothetical protein